MLHQANVLSRQQDHLILRSAVTVVGCQSHHRSAGPIMCGAVCDSREERSVDFVDFAQDHVWSKWCGVGLLILWWPIGKKLKKHLISRKSHCNLKSASLSPLQETTVV